MSNFVYAANEAEITIKPEESKTRYLMKSDTIQNNLGLSQSPSLSLYPSSLWSKQISIEDGNVLNEAENLITSQALIKNISTTKDALLYFKFRGGHLSVGVTNDIVGSPIYGFGIGFKWEGIVKDGVTISSIIAGPVDTRVNLTTLSDLPTTFHEFVMHVDRLRKKCVLYNVNTSAKLGEINIDGAQDVAGNPETTPKIFAYVLTGGTPETPYVRACKPNIIAIGDSITYRGTDIYPWYDYVKQLGLNLRTQGHKNWFVVNKGIGSQTSAMIDARIATDVVAHEPNYCFLQASNNDYGAVDYTTRNSNINSSISTLKTAGITVLLTNSIVPNSNHGSYPEIATYFKTWNADHFNGTIFPDATRLIDIMTPVADINGELDPTYADDGIHPNIAGYGLIGDSVVEQMSEWNPHSDTMNSGRKAYYEKDLYSELSAGELADETPTDGDIGCVNWNPVDGVQNIEIINEDSGGIEIGSLKIDMAKPFWGDSYIDLDEMIFYDHGGFEEVTVSSGATTLSANGTGTCYLVDSSGAFYFGTISGDAVTTDAPDGDYTVIYELETPLETSIIPISTGIELKSGNNIFEITPESLILKIVYNDVSSTSSTQAFIERFRATTKRGGRTFQPYGSRVLKSVPTSEEVAISLSKMNIDDETIGLALDGGHFQIENTYVNVNDGSEITDTYKHCRITSHGKEYSAGDIVKEDVEIECAKVVTS